MLAFKLLEKVFTQGVGEASTSSTAERSNDA